MSDALPETVDFVILTALDEERTRFTPCSRTSNALLRGRMTPEFTSVPTYP